jgi:hypothetical protein
MHIHRSLITKILIAVLFIQSGCSPAKKTASQPEDAINKIRKALELPDLPVEFVETTGMGNSPSGNLSVDVYQDSEGRKYSVEPKTNQVVEIDARSVLASIPADAPALPPEEIKTKVMAYVNAAVPDFASLQTSLQYEQGGKIDNYFFVWYGNSIPGAMSRPFLQIGIHKSGVLFAYYNTLNVEN